MSVELVRKCEYILESILKKGLNCRIDILLSEEERYELLKYPKMKNEVGWDISTLYRSPLDIIFGRERKVLSEVLEPSVIKEPYKTFKEGVDVYRMKGGSIDGIKYRMNTIKIEIIV